MKKHYMITSIGPFEGFAVEALDITEDARARMIAAGWAPPSIPASGADYSGKDSHVLGALRQLSTLADVNYRAIGDNWADDPAAGDAIEALQTCLLALAPFKRAE